MLAAQSVRHKEAIKLSANMTMLICVLTILSFAILVLHVNMLTSLIDDRKKSVRIYTVCIYAHNYICSILVCGGQVYGVLNGGLACSH